MFSSLSITQRLAAAKTADHIQSLMTDIFEDPSELATISAVDFLFALHDAAYQAHCSFDQYFNSQLLYLLSLSESAELQKKTPEALALMEQLLLANNTTHPVEDLNNMLVILWSHPIADVAMIMRIMERLASILGKWDSEFPSEELKTLYNNFFDIINRDSSELKLLINIIQESLRQILQNDLLRHYFIHKENYQKTVKIIDQLLTDEAQAVCLHQEQQQKRHTAETICSSANESMTSKQKLTIYQRAIDIDKTYIKAYTLKGIEHVNYYHTQRKGTLNAKKYKELATIIKDACQALGTAYSLDNTDLKTVYALAEVEWILIQNHDPSRNNQALKDLYHYLKEQQQSTESHHDQLTLLKKIHLFLNPEPVVETMLVTTEAPSVSSKTEIIANANTVKKSVTQVGKKLLSAEDHYQTAQLLEKTNGTPKKILESYKLAISLANATCNEPIAYLAYCGRGFYKLKNSPEQEHMDDFNQAIALDNARAMAYVGLGQSYEKNYSLKNGHFSDLMLLIKENYQHALACQATDDNNVYQAQAREALEKLALKMAQKANAYLAELGGEKAISRNKILTKEELAKLSDNLRVLFQSDNPFHQQAAAHALSTFLQDHPNNASLIGNCPTIIYEFLRALNQQHLSEAHQVSLITSFIPLYLNNKSNQTALTQRVDYFDLMINGFASDNTIIKINLVKLSIQLFENKHPLSEQQLLKMIDGLIDGLQDEQIDMQQFSLFAICKLLEAPYHCQTLLGQKTALPQLVNTYLHSNNATLRHNVVGMMRLFITDNPNNQRNLSSNAELIDAVLLRLNDNDFSLKNHCLSFIRELYHQQSSFFTLLGQKAAFIKALEACLTSNHVNIQKNTLYILVNVITGHSENQMTLITNIKTINALGKLTANSDSEIRTYAFEVFQLLLDNDAVNQAAITLTPALHDALITSMKNMNTNTVQNTLALFSYLIENNLDNKNSLGQSTPFIKAIIKHLDGVSALIQLNAFINFVLLTTDHPENTKHFYQALKAVWSPEKILEIETAFKTKVFRTLDLTNRPPCTAHENASGTIIFHPTTSVLVTNSPGMKTPAPT